MRAATTPEERMQMAKPSAKVTGAERLLLSAILNDPTRFAEVIQLVNPEMFTQTFHRAIYEAMMACFREMFQPDVFNVSTRLMKQGYKGTDLFEVTQIQMEGANRIDTLSYSKVATFIKIQSTLRQLTTLCQRGYETFSNSSADADTIENFERELYTITNNLYTKTNVSLQEAAVDLLKDVEYSLANPDKIPGVSYGFPSLDKATNGMKPGNLIVLAGRPGMGKSALVNSIAARVASPETPVGIFSLEMSTMELTERIFSGNAKVNGNRVRSRKLDDRNLVQLQDFILKSKDTPIYIDDSAGLSLMELKGKAMRMVLQFGVKLLIVDYLQLMKDPMKGTNREQEISRIARGLKNLAKELNVPVIALSQLNRSVETRGGSKRPTMADLRESGEIENAADMVGFVYRPEYYKITEGEDGNVLPEGYALIIIEKLRGGVPNTDVELRYQGKYTLFTDPADEPEGSMFTDATPDPLRSLPQASFDSDDLPF